MSAPESFFQSPVLNSPYEKPEQHWVLDENGQPSGHIESVRRLVNFRVAVANVKRKKPQASLSFGEELEGINYETADTITAIRRLVDIWRDKPERDWKVSAPTARLLRHWRRKEWQDRRPFFCQLEAVETAIWLTEVAAESKSKTAIELLAKLEAASQEANPDLSRWALKLATGAGKTTVMAMLIAWQTVNAVRNPRKEKFTRGFLIIAPGITIRDRLRVLLPTDADSYYEAFDLVPQDMLNDVKRAQIVITNYHAFGLRETVKISSGGRKLLEGQTHSPIQTLESPGQMLQRVCSELMGLRGIMVLNDEAHHCYQERPAAEAEGETIDDLEGDEKQEAKKDQEAARLWIHGIKYATEKMGVKRVFDLSATPFFLKGSGYTEGTLFPWTVSDFSLMDAIECGIVKLPRIPIADNIPSADIPQYRELWKHIGKKMPKKGRGKNAYTDPDKLPQKLITALNALYGHYKETFELWEQQQLGVPPCFIVVCNNTASSKLVYDYIAGYETAEGTLHEGRLDLFNNYLPNGMGRRDKPRTLLVDSRELESGDAINKDFLKAFEEEIKAFKREKAQREGQSVVLEGVSDEEVLREVLNTVGKPGKLGQNIRCVVSVSMLTEGWDCNTVTHVLGVRAFGTQLLCEQVMGRALRRYSYELDKDGKFPVEYADIFGIPFDFTTEPVKAAPTAPRKLTRVAAVRDRQELEIRFPRVEGYRIERPLPTVEANFTNDDRYVLDPSIVGATEVQNAGVIGEQVNMNLAHTADTRKSTIIMHLTQYLINDYLTDEEGHPRKPLFGAAKRVVREWLDNYLECKGGTYPAQLLFAPLAKEAAERINNAILRAAGEEDDGNTFVKPILDSYNPLGSTSHVAFNTSKEVFTTDEVSCHIDHVVIESGWEGEFARVLEGHPKVLRYVKNHGLGFEIPYTYLGERHRYIPDFIVLLDDGKGADDPLYLIAEVKGRRDEQVNAKHNTVKSQWLPAVNSTEAFGRWTFAEFEEPFAMREDLDKVLVEAVDKMIGEGLAFAKTRVNN